MAHSGTIAPVEMVLMDGRSVSLRLSNGALIRASERIGAEIQSADSVTLGGKVKQQAALIYECLSKQERDSVSYEEFLENSDPATSTEALIELTKRFSTPKKAGRPLAENGNDSPGSISGPLPEVTSDSQPENSST